MEYLKISTIQQELKRQYEINGRLQTFVYVVERLQRNSANIITQYNVPFPVKAGAMEDAAFYDCFQNALIPLDSLRATIREKNWRDHPAFSGKKAYIHVQKHINYVDQQYHQHSYYEITYIMKGSCVMAFDKTTVHMETGDMCIIVPSAGHGIRIVDDETFAVNIILSPGTFQSIMQQVMQDEDLISNYLKEIVYHVDIPNFLFLHTSNSDDMKSFIKEATCATHHGGDFSFGIAFNWISLFLCNAFREFRSSIYLYRNNNPNIQDSHLEILEYIQKNYKTATLEKIADHFGYNKSYASRLITRIAGKTFTEVITERKLADACEYLESTTLSVREIAELCGFEDANYFSKLFRKQYRVSPVSYRNTM